MKVSLNWAQSVSNVDLKSIPKDELLQKIGAQLGAIEEVIEWGPRYNGIVVVKVISCDPHPNADKLHVCRIDDGRMVEGMERDDDGYVQVVCGAPNVHAGMLAVWLPPNSTVPSSLDKEPLVLGARELRGVVSNGMLASPAELGISDNHDGILEVIAADVGEELAKPGTPFKQLYGMDDLVIDCENKMFTHRPDCFGILGIARELAGITGQKFKSPDWYLQDPIFKNSSDLPLNIKVSSDLVQRFMAVAMDNIRIEPSPMHIQTDLTRVGIRPINNVVDITNWLMHLTGQPLHAYDYDKLKALSGDTPTLEARLAVKDESVKILSGKMVALHDKTIVIASDKQPVGIAGVMGGLDTEVDANTKSIVIEVASFDMYSVRRASMRYGIFTDAVTRFNKGQSPLQNDRVMAQAIQMMHDLAGATQASNVFDVKSKDVGQMPLVEAKIDFINTRLGSQLTTDQAIALMANVECGLVVGRAQETRSYLQGVGNIDEKIERIGVKIVEKSSDGHYKLLIPEGTEQDYEKLVAWEIKPGFWCEYIGAKNAFLFKDRDTKVTRYDVNNDTEHEIVEMCRAFSNDYFTSLDSLLMLNSWYKPLLPLKKSDHIVEQTDDMTVAITPPFWRRDLEHPEDLVEEIGRLYGFDKLPINLPTRSAKPTPKNAHMQLLAQMRTTLKAAGANELLTYSFVHERLLGAVGQNKDLAFHVRNALSPDLQYYRLSLTPSLLEKVHPNIKAGFDSFAMYEFGRAHNKVHPVETGEVPEEYNMLAFVIAGAKQPKQTSAYYTAKTYLDYLGKSMGLQFVYTPITDMPDFPVTKPFDQSRSAFVTIANTKKMLGIIGEYRYEVLQSLKLPLFSAGFEISTKDILEAAAESKKKYTAVNKFPSTNQDITLQVPMRVSHSMLTETINKVVALLQQEHGYTINVTPGDIFVPQDSDKQRVSYTVTLSHPSKTLTTDEVNKALDLISRHAVTDHSAERI